MFLDEKCSEKSTAQLTLRRMQALYIPSHWVAVSNRHKEPTNIVYVMDSLSRPLHKDLPHLIAAAFRFKEAGFLIRTRRCTEQLDGSSCGAYAIAFITSDCHNVSVET